MPGLIGSVPKYRWHRTSGQAVVTLYGKDHLLGPRGTAVSRAKYDRLIAAWQDHGRQRPYCEQNTIVHCPAIPTSGSFHGVARDSPNDSVGGNWRGQNQRRQISHAVADKASESSNSNPLRTLRPLGLRRN